VNWKEKEAQRSFAPRVLPVIGQRKTRVAISATNMSKEELRKGKRLFPRLSAQRFAWRPLSRVLSPGRGAVDGVKNCLPMPLMGAQVAGLDFDIRKRFIPCVTVPQCSPNQGPWEVR